MKRLLIAASMLLALATQLTMALEDDQVRAEVVEVLTDSNEMRVRVLESGADQPARVGEIETYYVPEGTRFEYEIDSILYDYAGATGLSDLAEGDRVVLDFDEVEQRKQARNVRNEETQNLAMRERVQQEGQPSADADDKVEVAASNREELPESASALPLFALAGFVFAVFGGLIRWFRLRR